MNTKQIAWMVVGGLLAIVGLTWFFVGLNRSVAPVIENTRTEVIRNSNQYRSSAEAKLANWMLAYDDLEVKKETAENKSAIAAQQATILRQIKAETIKLGNDTPPSVTQWLVGK